MAVLIISSQHAILPLYFFCGETMQHFPPMFTSEQIKSINDVVSSEGTINTNKLRDYIAQETRLDRNCQFLTDYTAAIEFEVSTIDLPTDIFSQALQALLLKNVTSEDLKQFSKNKPNTTNHANTRTQSDPYYLGSGSYSGSSSSNNDFFTDLLIWEMLSGNNDGIEINIDCSGMNCSGGGGGGDDDAAMVMCVFIVVIVALVLCYYWLYLTIIKPAEMLLNSNRHESTIGASVKWMLALAGTGTLTAIIWTTIFPALLTHETIAKPQQLPDHSHTHLHSHSISQTIMPIEYDTITGHFPLAMGISFMLTTLGFTLSACLASLVNLNCIFPNEQTRKSRAAVNELQEIGKKSLATLKMSHPNVAQLEKKLENTNFIGFLRTAKTMGDAYYKAVQIIIEANIKSLENKAAIEMSAIETYSPHDLTRV